MDRLKTALDRLDRAIGRLDQSIAFRLERAALVGDGDGRALSEEEVAEINRALATALEGERRANETVEAVAGRLDGAIDRLRIVLEE